MKKVTNYSSYISYLKELIKENRVVSRGFQAKLAQQAGCHPTYLSQVIGGRVHLSLEHAYAMSEFLEFSELETEYFIFLVEAERAGNVRLKKYFESRLDNIRRQNNEAKASEAVPEQRLPRPEDESFYFENWYRPVLHLLILTGNYHDTRTLSLRVGLPEEKVEKDLVLLEGHGFINRSKGAWKSEIRKIHVSANSPVVERYHSYWRAKATLSQKQTHELRYSGVHVISKADVLELRSFIHEFLMSFRKKAEDSAEETLVSLSLDYLII